MLVLDEIARKEDVTVDDSELDQEVERHGRSVPVGPSRPCGRSLEKEGGMGRLSEGLKREKVIDFVLNEATVVTA